jgi:hypothetical protein
MLTNLAPHRTLHWLYPVQSTALKNENRIIKQKSNSKNLQELKGQEI